MQIKDYMELITDYSPIVLTLSEPIISIPNNPSLINKIADWENFLIMLEKRINSAMPLQTEEQLDFEVEELVKDILYSAWQNTTEIKIKLKDNNYPKEILELIVEKKDYIITVAPKIFWPQDLKIRVLELQNAFHGNLKRPFFTEIQPVKKHRKISQSFLTL
ncbi:hypothetical protein PV327_008753 [Microctonus hyperodae]|uniref:Uncharacterized protein n=1 Tax=Microctonus hyperodae TaxID=165561 RepID=A0AA39FSU5_MICHY|nr:hypothetical protein PV327_008753 [Microctonus hyperodae]